MLDVLGVDRRSGKVPLMSRINIGRNGYRHLSSTEKASSCAHHFAPIPKVNDLFGSRKQFFKLGFVLNIQIELSFYQAMLLIADFSVQRCGLCS